MQKKKIDELTEEEVLKVYKDAVMQDSLEKHSGLMRRSSRIKKRLDFYAPKVLRTDIFTSFLKVQQGRLFQKGYALKPVISAPWFFAFNKE